jgi:type II secretory pathway pseudopilin PulG
MQYENPSRKLLEIPPETSWLRRVSQKKGAPRLTPAWNFDRLPGAGFPFQPQTRFARRRDSGYILLTLLFFVAVLAITVVAVLPSVTQEVKRDREEELVHRGVQYARAIRKFYKKFGRYPTRIEELDNTNNIRFLRKRYKDPITGEDFKLLHVGEVKLSMAGGLGVPAAALSGAAGAAQAGAGGALGQRPPGQPAGTAAINPAAAGMAAAGGITNTFGQSSDLGAGGAPASAGNSLTGKTFGGGAIVGVASTSDNDSIRQFGGKSKYSDWQFIYSPNIDRGGLITTPAQPPLQGSQPQGNSGIPAPVAPVQLPGPGAPPPGMTNPPDQ